MKRYSLIILVLIVLILNTLMRQAAEANPLMDPTLWDLRGALPTGIAAAALCIATLGIGAQFWRSILPICGAAAWSPLRSWSSLSMSSGWCGWIPLLCAVPFLPGSSGAPSPWLIGCFFTFIGCRMLSIICRHEVMGLLTIAIAIICEHEFWPTTPLDILALGLISSIALQVLFSRESAKQLIWLMIAACGICAYTAAFGYTLAFYPPSIEPTAAPWGMWPALAYTLIALACIALPALRSKRWGYRSAAACLLLLSAAWLWLHFAAELTPQEQLPALGCYIGALLLFALPTAMMLRQQR